MVNVLDAPMGDGKTTWSITYTDNALNENILYVTPFLREIDRIKEKSKRDFFDPSSSTGITKRECFKNLLRAQADIATTHELFLHLNHECKKLIQKGNYTLVLDEVLDVVAPQEIKKGDLNILKRSGAITIDEKGLVSWNLNADVDTRFYDIKSLALNHNLLCIDNTFLVWRYPPDIFKLFKKVYVLTYRFEYSILCAYFKAFGIAYELKSLNDGNLCTYHTESTSKYSTLINVYDGKLNNIKQKNSSFSSTYFKQAQNKPTILVLKKNITNYFKNIVKAPADTILWTTFMDSKKALSNKGYTTSFLSWNTRATNDYINTYNLVYALNLYLNPVIIKFFKQYDIEINQDEWALTEMLQWIWRSRIRKKESINIYVPSIRMRTLLNNWINPREYSITNFQTKEQAKSA